MMNSVLSILLVTSIYITYAQELPTLPSKFTAIIEANIIQKNQTWIEEEWYDKSANKAKRAFYYGDLISVTYEDFSDGKDELWSYTTTHDDPSNAISCTLKSYSENKGPFTNDQSRSGGLVSSAEWFLFGSNFSETYIGKDFVIRGIAAEGWTRNVTNSFNFGPTTQDFNFALTYYFALESWDWFKSSQDRIPVRVELTGERVTTYPNGSVIPYSFHHYYDYVQFFADDLTLEDELDFDIPDFYEQCNVTDYCNTYPQNKICSITKGPAIPRIPNSFTANIEYSSTEFDYWDFPAQTMNMEIYYDYDQDRVKMVGHFMDGYYKNSLHELEIGQGSDIGQRWVWLGYEDDDGDIDITNCSLTSLVPDETLDYYFWSLDRGHIVNPHRWLIFDDNRYDPELTDEIWMGYTTIRGIPAEKWKANFNVDQTYGDTGYWVYALEEGQRFTMNGSIYWYFSSNWTFAYDTNDPSDGIRPLAMEMVGAYELTENGAIIDSAEISQYMTITGWLDDTPDDEYFEPPMYYKRDCMIEDAYCSSSNADSAVCDKGEDLPTLPQHKYYAVIELNDMVQNSTQIMKAWYNYDANQLRTEVYDGAQLEVTFDDLDEDRRWTWNHYINNTDDIISCTVESYLATIDPTNPQFAEEYLTTGHVKSTADLWRFGEGYNVTYLGDNFEVRGIPARAWHGFSSFSMTFNGTETFVSLESEFYFASTSWNYYKAIETADVPVKVIYKGSWSNEYASGGFENDFHIVSFFSGPEAFDESEMEFVFEDYHEQCNATTYCAVYPNNIPCTGIPSEASSDDKRGGGRLGGGYVVLMIVLFFIGLFIGALIDRWHIRKQGRASFQGSGGATSGNAGL